MTQEILFRYFKGQASPEEERQIGAWLLEAPEAQKEFEQAQFLFEGLVLHTKGAPQRKRLTFKTVFRYVAGIAAAAALVLATGHIVRQQTVDALSHDMMSLETRPGERAQVTLSDGTTVLLNADSRIEYPVTFQGDERHVKIHGEALFKVRHDEAHPFVVSTFVSDIRVLGTTFNVLADPQERLFSTTLMEGSVRVQEGRPGRSGGPLLAGRSRELERPELCRPDEALREGVRGEHRPQGQSLHRGTQR